MIIGDKNKLMNKNNININEFKGKTIEEISIISDGERDVGVRIIFKDKTILGIRDLNYTERNYLVINDC